MEVLIIILLLLALILGGLTFISRKKSDDVVAVVVDKDSECCGVHDVCQQDSLHIVDTHIEYFDDEELDAYANMPSCSYSDEQIKSMADVFYTLREEEVAAWLKSLQLRGIELPPSLREEALLVVSERRV